MTPEQTTAAEKRTPELDSKERRDVEKRAQPRAAIIHETIRLEGEHELERPVAALFWSGLAAGLSMGFSMVAEGLMQAALPDAPWRPLLTRLGYTVGFLIVILSRQQLFTENTLTPMLPLLTRRDLATLGKVARLWAVVLCANLLGGLLFAAVVNATQPFSPAAHQAFAAIGLKAMHGDFGTIFVRAIFAGWLIALMVWMMPAAESAQFAVIVVIAYLVGLADLAHSIAGTVETAFAVLAGFAAWRDFLAFLAPTLLGNILGGVALVAALNHAQVAADATRETEKKEDARSASFDRSNKTR
jgi:formate/nitrite transporter FocA (FNT family)